jgi:hypothetical protein
MIAERERLTAAARITELSEARTILLDIVSADVAAEA